MTTLRDWVLALLASPRDTALRLVAANWLLERGDHRGEWLRTPSLVLDNLEVPATKVEISPSHGGGPAQMSCQGVDGSRFNPVTYVVRRLELRKPCDRGHRARTWHLLSVAIARDAFSVDDRTAPDDWRSLAVSEVFAAGLVTRKFFNSKSNDYYRRLDRWPATFGPPDQTWDQRLRSSIRWFCHYGGFGSFVNVADDCRLLVLNAEDRKFWRRDRWDKSIWTNNGRARQMLRSVELRIRQRAIFQRFVAARPWRLAGPVVPPLLERVDE